MNASIAKTKGWKTVWHRSAALVLLATLLGVLLAPPPAFLLAPRSSHADSIPTSDEVDHLSRLLDQSRQATRQVNETYAEFEVLPEHRELKRNPWCAPIDSIELADNAADWVFGKRFVTSNRSISFDALGFVDSTHEDWCGTISRGTYRARGFTLYLTYEPRQNTEQATIDPQTGFLHCGRLIFRPVIEPSEVPGSTNR
jgi:hypothetical protein